MKTLNIKTLAGNDIVLDTDTRMVQISSLGINFADGVFMTILPESKGYTALHYDFATFTFNNAFAKLLPLVRVSAKVGKNILAAIYQSGLIPKKELNVAEVSALRIDFLCEEGFFAGIEYNTFDEYLAARLKNSRTEVFTPYQKGDEYAE
jgi:hypothetical protein